jgi:hypothetical protein
MQFIDCHLSMYSVHKGHFANCIEVWAWWHGILVVLIMGLYMYNIFIKTVG